MKKNKKKQLLRYAVPFMALVLIFGLALSCDKSSSSTEAEINEIAELEQKLKDKDKEIEDLKTEEDTEENVEAEYIANTLIILEVRIDSMEEFRQAISDVVSGDISMVEFKLITKEYIDKINSCYDMYLELEPPKRLEKAHGLQGKAMEHYLNSTTFLKSYIESDDTEDMIRYLEQSIAEISLGNEYTEKTTKEVEKFPE